MLSDSNRRSRLKLQEEVVTRQTQEDELEKSLETAGVCGEMTHLWRTEKFPDGMWRYRSDLIRSSLIFNRVLGLGH